MTAIELKVNTMIRLLTASDSDTYDKAMEELKTFPMDSAPPTDAMDDVIQDLLKRVGIPAHLAGYFYISEAIKLAVSDQSYILDITSKLYPAVARIFNGTPSRAERGIRHAIETGWNRADLDDIADIFGSTVSPEKAKPTNSEFIACLANAVKRKMKEL